jgi:hypothetical protein
MMEDAPYNCATLHLQAAVKMKVRRELSRDTLETNDANGRRMQYFLHLQIDKYILEYYSQQVARTDQYLLKERT